MPVDCFYISNCKSHHCPACTRCRFGMLLSGSRNWDAPESHMANNSLGLFMSALWMSLSNNPSIVSCLKF
eukprot:9382349-Prorocentrum_lima.AAC.1